MNHKLCPMISNSNKLDNLLCVAALQLVGLGCNDELMVDAGTDVNTFPALHPETDTCRGLLTGRAVGDGHAQKEAVEWL